MFFSRLNDEKWRAGSRTRLVGYCGSKCTKVKITIQQLLTWREQYFKIIFMRVFLLYFRSLLFYTCLDRDLRLYFMCNLLVWDFGFMFGSSLAEWVVAKELFRDFLVLGDPRGSNPWPLEPIAATLTTVTEKLLPKVKISSYESQPSNYDNFTFSIIYHQKYLFTSLLEHKTKHTGIKNMD